MDQRAWPESGGCRVSRYPRRPKLERDSWPIGAASTQNTYQWSGSGALHSGDRDKERVNKQLHTTRIHLRSAEASSDQENGRPGPDEWQCRSSSVECLLTLTARCRVTRPSTCVLHVRTLEGIPTTRRLALRSFPFIERVLQISAARRICTSTQPSHPSWAGDGRCGFVRNCVSCGRDRVVGEGGIVVMHRLLESHATWGVRCRDRYSLETDVSDCLRSGGRIRTPVLRLLFGRVRCRFEKSAA